MKRPIHVTVARYAYAMLLLGARWLLLRVGGSAGSTPAESLWSTSLTTTPPATDRPLIPIGGGHYAEWCVCGTPPDGQTVVVETRSGRIIAMHPECLHGRHG